MPPSENLSTSVLKKILFRPATKHPRLQRLWSRLHTISIFGMNYGGAGLIESSGEIRVLSEVVRPACAGVDAPVVFDVGANVGDYSLLVRRLIPGAVVYAFEPARSTYRQLEEQIAAAGAGDRIRPFNLGFSDAERDVVLYSYTADGHEASVLASIDQRLPTQVIDVRTSDTERIQVQTIDRFCEAEGVGRIDLLKLDVEGHELSILRGARRVLSEGLVSMIQFEFGPANIYSRTYFYDFWSILAGDYDIYRIIPGGMVRLSHYGEHLEIFLTTNYLAVRRRDS